MSINNRRVIDLGKVIWADLCYKNQEGMRIARVPKFPSVRGIEIADGYALHHPKYLMETNLERAIRMGIIDVWYPVLNLRTTSCREIVTYTHDKALSLWKKWCEKQFNKKG